ncbi:MAG: hypothetical protein R3B93_21935 [Bacteroidia bacterium]
MVENSELGDEGYNLEITEDLLTLSANQPSDYSMEFKPFASFFTSKNIETSTTA